MSDKPKKDQYMGWVAGLHAHHDHNVHYGESERFPKTIICEQCNSADGAVKRKFKLPECFSFSHDEIGKFVTATPNGWHCIDYDLALHIYNRLEYTPYAQRTLALY